MPIFGATRQRSWKALRVESGVILVELEPIGGSGAIENGFVEVWEGQEAQRPFRKIFIAAQAPVSLLRFVQRLFPPPQSQHTQGVHFTAGELLRSSYDQEKTADIQSRDHILPPLRLESLRELIAQPRCRLWIGYVAETHNKSWISSLISRGRI
jgi:hypothetical protein